VTCCYTSLESMNMRSRVLLEASGPGAFFPSHMQLAPQTVDKLQNAAGFGFDDGLHHQSLLLPSFNKALRRGLQTTLCFTCGWSRSYSQAVLAGEFENRPLGPTNYSSALAKLRPAD